MFVINGTTAVSLCYTLVVRSHEHYTVTVQGRTITVSGCSPTCPYVFPGFSLVLGSFIANKHPY